MRNEEIIITSQFNWILWQIFMNAGGTGCHRNPSTFYHNQEQKSTDWENNSYSEQVSVNSRLKCWSQCCLLLGEDLNWCNRSSSSSFYFPTFYKFSSQLRIQTEKEMENGCICACVVLTWRPIFHCNFKGQLPLEERRKIDWFVL